MKKTGSAKSSYIQDYHDYITSSPMYRLYFGVEIWPGTPHLSPTTTFCRLKDSQRN